MEIGGGPVGELRRHDRPCFPGECAGPLTGVCLVSPAKISLGLPQLLELLLHGSDEPLVRGAERLPERGASLLVRAEARAGPSPADEEDARPTPERLGSEELHDLDLGGRRDVRPAAGVQVEALDLDEPDRPFVPFGKASRPDVQSAELRRRDAPEPDRPRGPDLGRDGLLERRELLRPEPRGRELDVANLPAEVERRRLPGEPVLRHRGQEVLAGVLLHVVEPPRPVEADRGGSARDGRGEGVSDLPPTPLDVEDFDAVQGAAVSRLAAPFGIEDRVGEDRVRPASLLARPQDLRVEGRPVGISLVSGNLVHARRIRESA